MNLDVEKIINDSFVEREKKEITSWHASRLGSCLRGMYLERLGGDPDTKIDFRTLRVFELGNQIEEYIVGKIRARTESEGYKIETQVRIELPEVDVTGYADLAITKDLEQEVWEIKSKNSRAFWYMDKGEGANEHHKQQVWLYLKALKMARGRIIYLSKDDGTIREYVVRLDDKELEKGIMDQLNILNKCWKEKKLPPVAKTGTWQAKFCNYHLQCMKNEKG